ncbi:acyltransferase domain-containing protein [Butyrivibrio sp. XPD2002]|uniref:acyltransferase domain-containing protein n=1 Tax=Butyrivibrio sp. XPD2002 TaxID=1280665 RepID=UPI000423D219|nr:acyltransferase domain-containing protein [Butyrivibrio sp. XPD2002]
MPGEVTDAVLLCFENAGDDNTSASIPGLEILTDHLVNSVENRLNGSWQRFPEDIFIATIGCFSRFVHEHFVSYGYYGFDRDFWTTRQVNAKLFRIGELEYEIIDGNENLYLHIPSDAVMKSAPLNMSLDMAKEFFAKYFPEKENSAIRCESWLLAPKLKTLLKEDSNIIRFQNAFDIEEEFPDAMDFLEWVFHIAGGQRNTVVFADLPEDTSLQRGIKKLLLSSGCVGSAEGVLVRRF